MTPGNNVLHDEFPQPQCLEVLIPVPKNKDEGVPGPLSPFCYIVVRLVASEPAKLLIAESWDIVGTTSSPIIEFPMRLG